jgi:hypothetical protein
MAGIRMDRYTEQKDPAITWRFVLEIDPPDSEAGGGVLLGFTETMKLRCKQAVLPGVQVEAALVALQGFEWNTRGRTMFSKTMAFTFIDTAKGEIANKIRQWKEIVVGTESGNGAYKSDYACQARIRQLDVAGNVTLEMLVQDIWPTDIADLQLDGSASTLAEYQVTFSYDKHQIVGNDEGGSLGVEDSPAGEAADS